MSRVLFKSNFFIMLTLAVFALNPWQESQCQTIPLNWLQTTEHSSRQHLTTWEYEQAVKCEEETTMRVKLSLAL